MLRTDPELEVVGAAGDAEQALQELETLDVDAVLMDILLPGMGGIDARFGLRRFFPADLVIRGF